MTQRNIELLQETMQWLKDHPELHDQSDYWTSCGTPLCFAGWATHLNGLTRQRLRDAYMQTRDYAAFALGLTRDEALTLFASGNTIPMLELMVKDLVNGDVLHSPYDYRREVSEQ